MYGRRGVDFDQPRCAQSIEVMNDCAGAERQALGEVFDGNRLALGEHADDAQTRCVR